MFNVSHFPELERSEAMTARNLSRQRQACPMEFVLVAISRTMKLCTYWITPL